MTSGATIDVSTPGGDTIRCRVAEIMTPATMPALPGMSAAQAAKVLTDWHVTRVALLTYREATRQFCFSALEIDGQWWDLKLQLLTITAADAKPWEIN